MKAEKILFSSNAAVAQLIQRNIRPVKAVVKDNLTTYKATGRLIDVKA